MLIMAAGREGKPMDYDEPERWTRVGYERDEVTHGQAVRRPGVRVCVRQMKSLQFAKRPPCAM